MEAGLPTAEAALDPSLSCNATSSSRSSKCCSTILPHQDVLHREIQVFSGLIILWAAYLTLFLLGIDYPPDDPWFCLVLLWSLSLLGGSISKIVGLPSLLGQLIAGIILVNSNAPILPPENWGQFIRSSGLVVILLRSGLDINIEKIRRAGKSALRLVFLPALVEALVTAFASVLILDMAPLLALAMGFILAAVSPAVVVGGMLDLRRRGFGTEKGIPSMVIAAASLDDIVAISAFSMCVGLAIRDSNVDGIVVWFILPITVSLGIVLGIVGGGLLSCLGSLWDHTPCSRGELTAFLLLLGHISMFGAKQIGYAGSGPLASISMGAFVAYLWNQNPKPISIEISQDIGALWSRVSEPLLFGFVGTTLNFHVIPVKTVPFSIAIVVIGLLVRIPTAYLATRGSVLTPKERAFVAFSWIPKATVQAALAPIPLAMVNELMAGTDDYEQYAEWSRQIISVAVLSIILTAPLGSIFIYQQGHKWLHLNPDASNNKRHPPQKDCQDVLESLNKTKRYIEEVDTLMTKLVLDQNDSAAVSLTIAEVRQLLWHCKDAVNVNIEYKSNIGEIPS